MNDLPLPLWMIIAYFAGSYILFILEMIGSYFFIIPLFRLGIPITKRRIQLTQIQQFPLPEKPINTGDGKFKFISHNECLFRSRMFRSWGMTRFYFQTPFVVRCIAHLKLPYIDIAVMIPVGSTLFFCGFFVAIILGTIYRLQSGTPPVAFIFWIVIIGLCVVGYFSEKHKLEKRIQELKEILETPR